MIARRIRVLGKVQGVFFRDWTVGEAQVLGVTGWVRNRADGSIEVQAEGEAAVVEALVERLRVGSPASKVARLEVEDVLVEGLEGFRRRATV